MKRLYYSCLASVTIGALTCSATAAEQGFINLLDPSYAPDWTQRGEGRLTISNQIATTSPLQGVTWFSGRQFGDFILKLEFKLDDVNSNSGVFLRFPEMTDNLDLKKEGYEVQIFGGSGNPKPNQRTGAFYRVQAPTSVPLRIGEWNEMEIAVDGQQYAVILNGENVNQFTGSRGEKGYIGLQSWSGSVQFRNVRIKELITSPSTAALTQSGSDQPLVDILSQQAPNAISWATAPLDVSIPGEIRQSLTLLREDLLDEGKANPKAIAEAYPAAQKLCDALIVSLDERDRTLVKSGFRAAQADANTRVTNQSLTAHAPYRSSWPQYARIKDQRSEIFRQQMNKAALSKELPKVEWSDRTTVLRNGLDALYARYREALRQGK